MSELTLEKFKEVLSQEFKLNNNNLRQEFKQMLSLELVKQTQDIKSYVNEQTEELARIIAVNVAEPLNQHLEESHDIVVLQKEVHTLKRDVTKIKSVLKLQ